MTNQLNMVQHDKFGKMEILMVDDKPHFPATECATILGYSNPQKAIRDHCRKDGCTNRSVIDRLGREQEKRYINEGNLYRLIARSKLPVAVQFETWVFDEVLPSIRKHGAYLTDDTLHDLLSDPELAHDLFCKLQYEREKTTQLEIRLETQAPKVQYYNTILQSKNAIPITLIAKDYGLSAMAFNQLLFDLGIQHKIGGTWILYQRYADSGYTQSRTYYTGKGRAVLHTCWTQKGRLFLYDTLAEYGIFPSTFAVH